MNTIRTIEGATLLSIGVFCAAAIVNIGLHGGNMLNDRETEATAVVHLPTVTITAKRLSATARAAASSALLAGEHTTPVSQG